MRLGSYIKRRGLEELKNYKYSSGQLTPIDKLLTHWWEKAVLLVPKWISPNALTLVGFFAVLFGFGLVVCLNPSLTEPLPSCVHFLQAFLIFLYQTVDAIDGKHARRTGTSSPLGQLFDHGCDIILVTVCSVTMLGVTGSGVGLVPFLAIVISTQLHQFIYMWWEYHFRVFHTSTGVIGTTEAQLSMIACCLLGGIYGSEVFSLDLLAEIPFLKSAFEGIPLLPPTVTIQLALMLALIITNSGLTGYNMLKGIINAKEKLVASTQLLMFGLFVYAEWIFYRCCLMDGAPIHPGIVYYALSTAYSTILFRLCLSATCRCHFSIFQWPVIPFVFATYCITVNPLPAVPILNSPYALVVVVSVWNTIYLWALVKSSVDALCRELNVTCFGMKTVKKAR